MKRIAVVAGLVLARVAMATAAETSPDACFAEAKGQPPEQQERFIRECLGSAATRAPSTVGPEQRAKVCATIAANEGFTGAQLDAFLARCKEG